MQRLWRIEDQRLLERLNTDILLGPTLSRHYPSRRIYRNRDWSKYKMGVVILQTYIPEEARKSEAQEKDGEKCEFENYLEGMGLRQISFISRSTVSPLEKSRCIFAG